MDWNRVLGLLAVLGLHGAVFYGALSARPVPPAAEAVTVFVRFIAPSPETVAHVPPPPRKPAAPPRRPAKTPPREPPHPHLAAQAPVLSPRDAVEPVPAPAPEPEPEPGPQAAPAPPALEPAPLAPPEPAGPVTLPSEPALACPERRPPDYPRLSRRLGESGQVVLRVELDEAGRVDAAQVARSSGSPRLDAAALAAVRSWRCQAAHRDGHAVRAVATQPFNFTLEGR